MLCSAGNLFKDTVKSLFLKVYYKGRPEGVCHNEVAFKAFTKYRGDRRKKCPSEACAQSNREWIRSSDGKFHIQFESPSYLDINPVIIVLIRRIFHKDVLKFQVPVHDVCEM